MRADVADADVVGERLARVHDGDEVGLRRRQRGIVVLRYERETGPGWRRCGGSRGAEQTRKGHDTNRREHRAHQTPIGEPRFTL